MQYLSGIMFEDEDQAKAYSIYRPSPPQQIINLVLDYMAQELESPYDLAVDVGCGTGQSSIALAPHFGKVTACDVSKSQIQQAQLYRTANNVFYKLCPAEKLPVEDNCVQLLTAANSFHWFDHGAFFREANRILMDGGVVAIYSSPTIYPHTNDDDLNAEIRQFMNKLLYEDLAPYRVSCVTPLLEEYRNVNFPLRDVYRIGQIKQFYVSSVCDCVGYVRSMSTFQNLRNADPIKAEDLLTAFEMKLLEMLGMPLVTEEINYVREYFLVMGRK